MWLWPWQDILSRFTESPNPSRGQSREVLHINSSLYCRVGTQRALLILYIKHSDGLMVAQPLKYGRHPSWVLEDRKVGKVDVNALSESWNGNWNSHCFMFSTWVCLCLVLVTMYWKSEGLKHQINYINKQNIIVPKYISIPQVKHAHSSTLQLLRPETESRVVASCILRRQFLFRSWKPTIASWSCTTTYQYCQVMLGAHNCHHQINNHHHMFCLILCTLSLHSYSQTNWHQKLRCLSIMQHMHSTSM